MANTRIYILGAGCSVCGGYPLAGRVKEALKAFYRDSLQDAECQKLRDCVEKTCHLMDECGVDTTDQLAQKLGEDRRDEIESSKKAISALFFKLEDDAVKAAYPRYARFFEEVFEQGQSPMMEDRVKATNCRVFTYNYDRLFERTFIQWALRQDKKNVDDPNPVSTAMDWLNSSLRNPSKVEFIPNQFAFLKLHGGIGRFFRNKDHGLNHIYPFAFDKPLPKIADNPYFEIPDQKTNMQTIFYPTDKRTRQTRRSEAAYTSSSLRGYEDTVWNAAESMCEAATEIQIIGYSMQPIDWWWFKDLLQAAKSCRKVIVRNRPQVTTYLERKLERLRAELGTTWQIEGRVEDFFDCPIDG